MLKVTETMLLFITNIEDFAYHLAEFEITMVICTLARVIYTSRKYFSDRFSPETQNA